MIECVVPLPADRPFSIPEVAARPAIRRLNVNDLSLLQSITPAKTYRLFKRFIQQGFQCYAALVDGKVVGYNWYTDRPYRSPFTGILFPCHPDEMFLVYSHTLPAWRSRGVDGVLKAETLNEFQRRGIRTIRSVIDEMNRPSLRMMSRWGGVPCRRHRYRRWLWWRRATSESIQPTPELMTRLVGRIPRSHEEAAAHIAARQKSRAHADS
jgi:GNAT superfamily N-acetyltransferase